MGRAEAFALQNPPLLSAIDGLANGIGYAIILGIIGFFRELLGSGEVLLFEKWFGFQVSISSWYESNLLMIMAPGAFIALGFLIALFNVFKPPEPEDNKP